MNKTNPNEKIHFHNYKSLGKHLKSRTTKDFFITGTSSSKVTAVIVKDGKLATKTDEFQFWRGSEYDQNDPLLIDFINFIESAD